MNIASWNINKKQIEDKVYNLIKFYKLDVLFLFEAQNFDKKKFSSFDSNKEYSFLNLASHKNFVCIYSKVININLKTRQSRYCCVEISTTKRNFLFSFIHLESQKSSSSDAKSCHEETLRALRKEIFECKAKYNLKSYFIMGDMNCNPFDKEMISFSDMNVTLFKRLFIKKPSLEHEKIKYDRLYNPILTMLSEPDFLYGSYYHYNRCGLYWNAYDQILINRYALSCFKEAKFLTSIEGQSLLKNLKPDANISDHLPVMVTI
ncbi:MAG: hypothetical protein MJ211_12520 [Bacteroidales bacterium]|nr:hypothetical protein [Bacteroidales bacterium]